MQETEGDTCWKSSFYLKSNRFGLSLSRLYFDIVGDESS